MSDFAGSDIKSHNNNPEEIVTKIRDWIRVTEEMNIPSGGLIWQSYNEFYTYFQSAAKAIGYKNKHQLVKMPVPEFIYFIKEWKRIKGSN